MLKPARVDRYSGYRFYALEQLPRLNRILALKDLGFSLEQVAQLLDDNLPTAELRGMLRLKQTELANRVEAEQARLARLQLRLVQLDEEERPAAGEVVVKMVPRQTVLVGRTLASGEGDVWRQRHRLQMILRDHLKEARLKAVGPWFALRNDLIYGETEAQVEMAVGVNRKSGSLTAGCDQGQVRLHQLSEVDRMATIVHQGEYAFISQAYTVLVAWTQANGYRPAGAYREIYLSEFERNDLDRGIVSYRPDSGSSLIEVQCPVERVPYPITILPSKSNQEESIMKPKYVTKPAFNVVGLSYVGKNEQNEIPQLWQEFLPRMGETDRAEAEVAYGACFSDPEGAAENEFEYVAGVEVKEPGELPQGMVLRQIPERKYAVFTHYGRLDNLGDTYQYIYNTWVPQSGHELADDKFDIEVYTEKFFPDSDKSEFYIYIAIK